jgi:hypothetical protein
LSTFTNPAVISLDSIEQLRAELEPLFASIDLNLPIAQVHAEVMRTLRGRAHPKWVWDIIEQRIRRGP